MSRGDPTRTNVTYASPRGSFLSSFSGLRWSLSGRIRKPITLGEPVTVSRSWLGFERRSHGSSQTKEPLTPKGPAFWSKAVTTKTRRGSAQQAGLALGREGRLQTPWANCCAPPWLCKAVYFLVVLAGTLFFVLMSLISAYLTKASNIDFFILRLAGQQRRLVEAVRNYDTGQQLSCVSCEKNWMQRADDCYLFTPERMSWQECVDHCIAQQGSILIGQSEGEMDSLMLETRKHFLTQNLHREHSRYWIGLMYNQTSDTWHWANGELLHIRIERLVRPPVRADDLLALNLLLRAFSATSSHDCSRSPQGLYRCNLWSATEKVASFVEDVCVLFHKGHEDNRKCTHKNHCICKKMAT